MLYEVITLYWYDQVRAEPFSFEAGLAAVNMLAHELQVVGQGGVVASAAKALRSPTRQAALR